MPHDLGDLGVVVHLRQDALPDRRVFLHLPALLERERAGLLQEAGGESDLADVVDKTAEVRHVLALSSGGQCARRCRESRSQQRRNDPRCIGLGRPGS